MEPSRRRLRLLGSHCTRPAAAAAAEQVPSPIEVPTIDLSRLHGTEPERAALAAELRACCHSGAGFFYLVGLMTRAVPSFSTAIDRLHVVDRDSL